MAPGRTLCFQLLRDKLLSLRENASVPYQNYIKLDTVVVICKGGNLSNFITTNLSTLLSVEIKNCSLQGFKQIYNNDNKNAENAIQNHNYYNDIEVISSKVDLSIDNGGPPHNLVRFTQQGNKRVFTQQNTSYMNTGFYKNGDIILVEGKYAPFIAYQKSAIGFRSPTLTNFWQVSGVVSSNILTVTDSGFNVYDNLCFPGMEIVIPGAGASGADLLSIVTDVSFNVPNTITIAGNILTAITNIMTHSIITKLYQTPLFQYNSILDNTNENNSSGDIVINTDGINGEYAGWTYKWDYVTATYGFVPFGQTHVRKGATASRPTAIYPGYMYFDITLATNGEPIWWNGTNWVNSLGVIV